MKARLGLRSAFGYTLAKYLNTNCQVARQRHSSRRTHTYRDSLANKDTHTALHFRLILILTVPFPYRWSISNQRPSQRLSASAPAMLVDRLVPSLPRSVLTCESVWLTQILRESPCGTVKSCPFMRFATSYHFCETFQFTQLCFLSPNSLNSMILSESVAGEICSSQRKWKQKSPMQS